MKMVLLVALGLLAVIIVSGYTSKNNLEKQEDGKINVTSEEQEPIQCEYCQYLVNNACVDYECCKNSDCPVNKACINHTCQAICPSSCDDSDQKTNDYCNPSTDWKCKNVPTYICGNGICEKQKITMIEGQSIKIMVAGKNHTVKIHGLYNQRELRSENEGNKDVAIINIDGEIKEISEGYTDMISGVDIFVDRIKLIYLEGGGSVSSVTFVIGENNVSCPRDCVYEPITEYCGDSLCGNGICENNRIVFENEDSKNISISGAEYIISILNVSYSGNIYGNYSGSAYIGVGNVEKKVEAGMSYVFDNVSVFVENIIPAPSKENLISFIPLHIGENNVSCPGDCLTGETIRIFEGDSETIEYGKTDYVVINVAVGESRAAITVNESDIKKAIMVYKNQCYDLKGLSICIKEVYFSAKGGISYIDVITN
jgi:hypothetical protein